MDGSCLRFEVGLSSGLKAFNIFHNIMQAFVKGNHSPASKRKLLRRNDKRLGRNHNDWFEILSSKDDGEFKFGVFEEWWRLKIRCNAREAA